MLTQIASFILSLEQPQRVFAASLIAGALLYRMTKYYHSPWRCLPPGPQGVPLFGNMFQLRSQQWLAFTEMRKTFGDIIYLNVAGQPLIVVGSQKAAADLLDRRATIHSDRPRNIVASEIMTGGLLVVFTRYSDIWRRMRRAAHEGLNKQVAHKYHATQVTEAIILAADMITRPDNWDAHLRRAAASGIMSVVYDAAPISSENDSSVVAINDFVARLTRAAYPGAHFVEFFPWMKHIPSQFAKWKLQAERNYTSDSAMFEGLFGRVRERISQGDERPSLANTLVRDATRNNLSERENAWLAGTMYAAGAETTSAVMAWWMLAMVAYPETQDKARAELDRVVGRDRPPAFADIDNLPYLCAMVKEALRWRPVDPVGLPHYSMEDDWYNGHFIPAGSIIIANVWHLNRDPDIYGADAAHFNPARHLDDDGQLRVGPVDTKDEGHVTYGFGRRICVGRHVANNSLFIDMAMMLWALKIEPYIDGTEPMFDLSGCIEDGLVVRPIPFKVKITSRSQEVASFLEQERATLLRQL